MKETGKKLYSEKELVKRLEEYEQEVIDAGMNSYPKKSDPKRQTVETKVRA